MATIKKKDYNHCLLDEYWILAPFGDVLTEFKQKCAALSKERRVQEKNFDKQQAAAKAKLETIKEIQGALVMVQQNSHGICLTKKLWKI